MDKNQTVSVVEGDDPLVSAKVNRFGSDSSTFETSLIRASRDNRIIEP